MNTRARKGRDRLERIAALLLSLAGLAERAAARSAPVRFIVLWLLRQAETVAADFVGIEWNATFWDDPSGFAPDHLGYGPADALALALSLRLLALVVQATAQDAARHPDEAALSACLDRLARIGLGVRMVGSLALECFDTS